MGASLSCQQLCQRRKQQKRLLLLGLDAAGKTTILYRLATGKVLCTIPTIGFNVESIRVDGKEVTAWDIGGRDKIRPLYRHYYGNAHAVAFVMDAADEERISLAVDELRELLAEEELKDCPIAVLCNKSDLPHAAARDQLQHRVMSELDKDLRNRRNFALFATSAVTAQGLDEAFTWLVTGKGVPAAPDAAEGKEASSAFGWLSQVPAACKSLLLK